MNRQSHRLWYFEAHLPDGTRQYVGSSGCALSADDVLANTFVGTEEQAHAETDMRCERYDKSHPAMPARAMSFSPASTLPPHST